MHFSVRSLGKRATRRTADAWEEECGPALLVVGHTGPHLSEPRADALWRAGMVFRGTFGCRAICGHQMRLVRRDDDVGGHGVPASGVGRFEDGWSIMKTATEIQSSKCVTRDSRAAARAQAVQ